MKLNRVQYWKAELLFFGELENGDFPERDTVAEAIEDARQALCILSERESKGITAGVFEWRVDNGICCNTGWGYNVTCSEVTMWSADE